MKRLLFVYAFLLVSLTGMAQFTYYEPVIVGHSAPRTHRYRNPTLDDDDLLPPFTYYKPVVVPPRVDAIVTADVYCTTSSGHKARYVLDCGIQKNRNSLSVVAIYFDDDHEQSVHTGYNDSDYRYSGGTLSIQTDDDGNIVSAQTVVSVSYTDRNYWQRFEIIL